MKINNVVKNFLEDTTVDEIISHEGGKWLVKSKKGKVLGTHDTKDAALKQLAAVEISKAQRHESATSFPREVLDAAKEVADAMQDILDDSVADAINDNEVLYNYLADRDDTDASYELYKLVLKALVKNLRRITNEEKEKQCHIVDDDSKEVLFSGNEKECEKQLAYFSSHGHDAYMVDDITDYHVTKNTVYGKKE